MFLLYNIKFSKQNYENLIKYLKLDRYIKKINTKVFVFNQIDNTVQIKCLSIVYNKTFLPIKSQNLIKYVINICFLKKNTFIIVTDIKGKLKFCYSSGLVDLKGKRKVKQPLALNSLIKILELETSFLLNKPLALHLTNVNTFSYKYVLSKIKNLFFITFIRVCNKKPHNGCRPRKQKRGKKRRKKSKN
jgi:ribosomal protein S11